MSALLEKIKKNSKLGKLKTLNKSEFLNNGDNTPTDMPVLNLAFSGEIDKGFRSGLIQFAGPSKHFKTNLALICVKSYLNKNPDAICLFFDSEFGVTEEYLKAQGIDPERMVHIPIMNVEELKFELLAQLEGIARGDKVIILIDSIGNLASKKEVEDALNEKSVADMSRAKQLKSLFRMATPYLTMKDIPMIGINHTYKEQGLFPKDIVGGGTGAMYSSNVVFIIGRAQEKDGSEVSGYTFTLNVEKSRDVKEKSKLKFKVLFESGVCEYSGLLDIAMAAGFVKKPSSGWYQRVINGQPEDKRCREKDTENKEFWAPIISDPKFKEACSKIFKLQSGKHSELEDDIDLNEFDEDAIDIPNIGTEEE